jgi:hypothetical protein
MKQYQESYGGFIDLDHPSSGIPTDPNNRHYTEMMRLVDAGEAEVIAYVEPVPGYAELRRVAYGRWGDQLDMQYHDSVDGTTTWVDHVAAVKAAHPK